MAENIIGMHLFRTACHPAGAKGDVCRPACRPASAKDDMCHRPARTKGDVCRPAGAYPGKKDHRCNLTIFSAILGQMLSL